MSKPRHIHRLKKHKYKTGVAVYFCTLPDCHFKIEAPFALGKESLCNICGEPFLMNEYTIKLVKPHCINCGKKEVKDENGNKHYIRKSGGKTLAHIAADATNELKSRLDGIVRPLADDDI
jgi:hypothetical protein